MLVVRAKSQGGCGIKSLSNVGPKGTRAVASRMLLVGAPSMHVHISSLSFRGHFRAAASMLGLDVKCLETVLLRVILICASPIGRYRAQTRVSYSNQLVPCAVAMVGGRLQTRYRTE